jgi:hypothetical protein
MCIPVPSEGLRSPRTAATAAAAAAVEADITNAGNEQVFQGSNVGWGWTGC